MSHDFTRSFRRHLAEGKTTDQALAALRAEGASIIDSVCALLAFCDGDFAKAEEIVRRSPIGADQQEFRRYLREWSRHFGRFSRRSLDTSRPLVRLVLRYGRGDCDPRIVDAELKRHEQAFGVELRAGDTSRPIKGYIEIPETDESVWAQYVSGDFFRFLDATHAVMHGLFVSDHCHVLLGGKYAMDATARAWGQIYADWANRAAWLGEREWTYVPFYSGSICDEFEEWMDSFYDFLQKHRPS